MSWHCRSLISRSSSHLDGAGCFLVGLLATIGVARGQVTGIASVDLVDRLTGPGSLNNTPLVAIGGTDLGHMVVHQDRTYLLFGDTFSGETPTQGGLWRWNTMAFTTDLTPSDGLFFDGWITDAQGRARQVILSGYQNPITEIPTAAVSIGNRIYAWFMSVNWWGPPGEWTINYAGLAYTENLGQSFVIVDNFRLPATTNFGMVAASFRADLSAGEDDYLYVWGTPAGRLGGVKLARVLPAEIANPAAYRYYGGLSGGQPTWIVNETLAPTIVPATVGDVPTTVGEMSVMYNPAARRWIMLYFNHNRYAIQLRQAATPWGPWSTPLTVIRGSQVPGLYGSYMNPLYVENHGETVYFTMSLWVPYDVYWVRLQLEVTSPPCPADFDLDGDVDEIDTDLLRSCVSGMSVPYSNILTCGPADLDHDGDIDQSDYGMLQRCISGPDEQAAPGCIAPSSP